MLHGKLDEAVKQGPVSERAAYLVNRQVLHDWINGMAYAHE